MNPEKKHAEESTPGGCGFFLSREDVDGQDHIPGKGDDQENALEEPTKLHCLRRVREGCLRREISYRWNDGEQTGDH